jgi:integrase
VTRTRRGHGEGSIYRRADGLWCASVEFGRDTTGRRRRKIVKARTKAEVLRRMAEVRKAQTSGLPLPEGRVTVGALLERWLETVKVNRSHATWSGYEQRVRLHLRPALGSRLLAKLGPADVQRLLDDMRTAGYGGRNIQHTHATLRAALGMAERWGMVPRNVAKLVSPVSVRRPEVVPFTSDEVHRLLDAAPSHPMGAFYVVAMAVGLRPQEALALRWEDVELDGPAPSVRVHRAVKRIDGGWEVGPLKTDRSRRTIPLPKACVTALREHRRGQAEQRLAAGPAWQDHGLLFTTTIGTLVDPSTASRRFGEYCKVAEVTRHRLYDLRHTAASLLLVQGVAPRVVMELLGHSTYQLTMNTYSHVMPSLLTEAADAMDRAFES